MKRESEERESGKWKCEEKERLRRGLKREREPERAKKVEK